MSYLCTGERPCVAIGPMKQLRNYTPDELSRLHAELYALLGEADRVCRKHGIPYFLVGGTAIGALYDQAILPWDDDVDIGMTRDAYERFLQVAPAELGKDYFLSWVGTDPHTPYYYAKLKKNGTLFVEPLFRDVPMHQGIYIDILPFDRVPDNRFVHRVQRAAVNFLKCCLMGKEAWLWRYFGRCRTDNPSRRGPLPCLLNRVADALLSKRQIYRLMRAAQTLANGRRTRYFSNIVTTTDYIAEDDVRDLRRVPFGPLSVTAPARLEAFLRHNYPSLHRYDEHEQQRVAGHCPEVLSFGPDSSLKTSQI